ncbi:UV radiation resistance protein, partial [Helicobacter pylori]
SENLENALFFKQISQYAKDLRLKILTAPSNKKDLERLEKLEKTINQEEERLNAKDLNALEQEIQKERENALKLKESIKAKQNHTETLKNAINQKESAKNPIQQQKQNLESQKNEKEREKHNQENAKRNLEQERNNLNNEINAIGNERITIKELGTKDNFLGIQEYFNDNGRKRSYARAFFSDKNKSIKEYYELETKIKNILGFYRIGASDERVLQRFLQLSPQQQNEVGRLLLE